MIYYAEVSQDGSIVQQHNVDVAPSPLPADWQLLSTPIHWGGAPIPGAVLTWVSGALVWRDDRTIEGAKAMKNAEINQKRLLANRTSFLFAGKSIACDELSMLDIASANGIITLTGAMPPNWPGGWKAIDNTYVPIPDKATWVSFFAAMVQAGTDNFNHSQTLKSALAAATTNAAVDSIEW